MSKRRKLHWSQRPENKGKLRAAHKKAVRTRMKNDTDEAFGGEEEVIDKGKHCQYCGRYFRTEGGANRHENKCHENPEYKSVLRAVNPPHSKVSGNGLASVEKRIKMLQMMVEELATGEILAIDMAKNRMIVSVPIEIPLKEIGVSSKEDL